MIPFNDELQNAWEASTDPIEKTFFEEIREGLTALETDNDTAQLMSAFVAAGKKACGAEMKQEIFFDWATKLGQLAAQREYKRQQSAGTSTPGAESSDTK